MAATRHRLRFGDEPPGRALRGAVKSGKKNKNSKKTEKITGKILLNKKSDFVIKNTFITEKNIEKKKGVLQIREMYLG